jgi:hypothetical protein
MIIRQLQDQSFGPSLAIQSVPDFRASEVYVIIFHAVDPHPPASTALAIDANEREGRPWWWIYDAKTVLATGQLGTKAAAPLTRKAWSWFRVSCPIFSKSPARRKGIPG